MYTDWCAAETALTSSDIWLPFGSTITVTGKAIAYDSTVDRAAMHKMNEGMIASPTNR